MLVCIFQNRVNLVSDRAFLIRMRMISNEMLQAIRFHCLVNFPNSQASGILSKVSSANTTIYRNDLCFL